MDKVLGQETVGVFVGIGGKMWENWFCLGICNAHGVEYYSCAY
jgi:hypothetical protein